ncbi:hypothetical protein ACFL1R_09820 [Candidatus Latescibacterota bacterium]
MKDERSVRFILSFIARSMIPCNNCSCAGQGTCGKRSNGSRRIIDNVFTFFILIPMIII